MVTLPPELVSQVIRELFTEADDLPSDEEHLADLQAFKCLRLAARHIKADAHAAWPNGLAQIANGAAQRILLLGATPDAFQQGLDEARDVLAETRLLGVHRDRYQQDDERLRDEHDDRWFSGVKHIVASTRALNILALDCARALLDLGQLPLAHLRLRELFVTEVAGDSLKGLDLSDMDMLDVLEIEGTEQEVAMPGFRLPPRASSITISWTRVTSQQIEALQLESNSALRHLDLTGSRLDRPLPVMPALIELSLIHADINDRLLPSLAPWDTLELVKLDGNSITTAAPLRLATNTMLQRLDVSSTDISDAAFFELKTNTGLKKLDVAACQFTSLAFGLASNRTLEELSMSGCSVTTSLMRELVAELARNSTLSRLNLDECHLNDEVMVHFKLEKTSGLKVLDLGWNKFTDRGVQPLADSITEHGLLRELHLWSCPGVTRTLVTRLNVGGRIVLWG